jgi:hypothetical protein
MDRTRSRSFAKQEFADEEGAKSEKQAEAEATGFGQYIKVGREVFQDVDDVRVRSGRKGVMEEHKGES